jgi:hypothetical protein
VSDPPVERRRVSGGVRLWLLFTTLLVAEVGTFSGVFNYLISFLWSGRLRELGGWFLYNLVQWLCGASFLAALLTLFGGGTLATVALAFRYARGAVAGSKRDPVMKVRDLLREHPRVKAVLPWVPSLLLSPLLLTHLHPRHNHLDWQLTEQVAPALGYLVAAALNVLMNRFALRSLDMLRDRDAETATAVSHDETSFQAVAVTARTQGAVIGMTALTIFMVYQVGQSGTFWMRDTAHGLPLVAYALASVAFAAWFRKASTIAVGRDGIFVRGTSKERFYSYQDFDEVRLAGMHFDFHRAGKRVLRLQLHGTDDARAEALAERIRAALAQSRRTDGAHLLARSAVGGSLGRAAQGATDYRQPSVSREQLWELVEGEATDRQARLAAAEALAGASGADDRARLRIAAAHVADPKVRVALEDLADDEHDAAAAPATNTTKPARSMA